MNTALEEMVLEVPCMHADRNWRKAGGVLVCPECSSIYIPDPILRMAYARVRREAAPGTGD